MSETIVEERVCKTSLRDLYYVFFRHKWKMILFFFAVFITVAVGTFLCAKVYRSEAKLLVQLGRESVTLDPTAATGQIIQVQQSRESEINSELEILNSRELAEKVVDAIEPEAFLKRPDEELSVEGVYSETIMQTKRKVRTAVKGIRNLFRRLDLVKPKPISDRDKVVLGIMKKLEIENVKDSSIIRISFEAKSPELAQQVVAKLIDLYLLKHIAVHQTPGSHQFFIQQSDHLQDKLVRSENELRNLKNETGISSVKEQQLLILNRISTLEQEIGYTEAELASSTAKVQALQKTLNDVPETLETLLAEQATLSSLQAKVEVQKRQLADVQAELKTLNDAEVRITRLMREASIQEVSYRKYSENLEQARIDHAMESERISNISVVQTATLPIKAVRPRKSLNLALGLFLGIFGAIGLAFFSEYLDHSIKTPEEAEERLQLPALASIPRVRGVHNRVSPTVKRKVQSKAGGKIAEKVLSQWNVCPRLSEHYEAFRERLLLCTKGSTGKAYVLAVISCHRHEGVSTVAANLAITLSRPHDNGHVLLVDADVGHPSVHGVFMKAKLSPGLADILTNSQSDGDAIQPLPAQNLHILSAGTKNGNLSEIFDSDRFTKLLNSVKGRYRFVVIDVPALNGASSAARLAGLCDGVVLVVEAERLRWEIAQRVKEQLVRSNANVLGVVLNKRRFHIPSWLYRTL